MTDGLIGALVGFLVACILILALKRRRPGSAAADMATTVFSSIENLRSIGELTAFRIHTKEIVTAENHSLGQWGKKYMNWLLSTRKMALILSFDTDFKYDLRSPEFEIDTAQAAGAEIQMPACYYDIRIRGISIYDEQESKLLPWLLPDLINSVFGTGFGPSEKNQLIEEAKNQAAAQARDLVRTMQSEVQESAAQTIKTLARGFGVDDVRVQFADAAPVQKTIEYGAPEELADSGEAA